MNIKRAIGVGVLTYLSSFILIIVSMPIATIMWMNDLSIAFNQIYKIINLILAGLFTLFYFKDKKIKRNAKEGFLFGIVLIIVTSILNIIAGFIQYNLKYPTQITLGGAIRTYFSHSSNWITLILFVVTTTIVGAMKEKKKKR